MNIRTSLIDAFATFILLSCVKFLSVTFDLLAPTSLYNSYGDTLDQYRLYYDPTVELFDEQHLPYGLIAICHIISACFPTPTALSISLHVLSKVFELLRAPSPGSAYIYGFIPRLLPEQSQGL